MKSLLLTLFALAIASATGLASPLRVLVVTESSDPAARSADELADVLKQRGAQAERMASFPDETRLGKTDVLVLLGSEMKPTAAPQRDALEKFAQRGGGLVAIHGGAAAGEATWWKPLIGGAWTPQSQQFRSRMMLYTLPDVHPITREASPFDIDDDTLYDLDTDPAINVLASAFTSKTTNSRNAEKAAKSAKADRANIYDVQPQMWAFEAPDRHRAFVLLQGAEATLKHTSVRSLILRGIAWTAKREAVDELCSQEELATLRYPKDGPQRAAETIKQFEIHPGFQASVVASEPLINKPIAVQWDARGRLWIAETVEYPNGRRPAVAESWKETGVLAPGQYDRPARDRISILEDQDGDGVMDKKTVFHEGLELVTGFCLYGDGAIVVGQPDIVFLHDTDGDDRADNVERLFTGFTPGDTHFVANHFIVAPDGWIYVDTGSGPDAVSIPHPEVKAKLSPGLFRFQPDGSAIEQVSSKNGNSFGGEFTSDGELFFGQATSGNPVQHVVLPEWVLAKGKVGSTASAESVIKGRKVVRPDMPERAALMQIDQVGGYSAACSSLIYEGGAWPGEWNHGIFCTEPILDIIHYEKLVPAGPTFTGEMVRPDQEWLRSRDYWFFPVDVSTGPDGAMYVLDFYNPVVAHSDSRGPQHSKAGASIRPDRDHYFGRIYRIQHEQARKLELPDLSKADAAGLVKAFAHPNKTVRFTAHRLLMDRKDAASVTPALTTMAGDGKFPPARILALWALQRLGKLEAGTLQAALKSEDAGVRKSALLIAEATRGGTPRLLDVSSALNDSDPRVRLTALRVLASTPMDKGAAALLLAVLSQLDDDWSKSAAVAAAASNAGPMLEAVLAAKGAPGETVVELAASLAAGLADKEDSTALAKVVLAAANPAANPALARSVLESAATHAVPEPADRRGLDDALKTLLASDNAALAASALPFAAAWDKSGALKSAVGERINALLALSADAQQPDATRASAIRALLRARAADARIATSVVELLKTKLSDPLLLDTIAALAATADSSLGKPLTSLLPNLSPIGQTALFDALSTRAEWANDVLEALAGKAFAPALLGPPKLSKLRLHPDPAVAKRAVKVFAEIGAGSNPAKDEIIAKLLPQIEGKPGDATKGKVLFASVCAVCHKLNGEGKEVGPILDGIGVHGASELLVSILDPSRLVDNEHRTWSLALKNGSFATGIIARENERALTLRLPGGAEQEIKAADIKSRQDTGLSLMPEGFEALGADGLRDLLAYLAGGSGKFRALNLTGVFTTDTGAGLYNSREAKNDTVPPVRYGVVTVEGVPFALPDPTTTPTGGNVIVLKNADGKTYASTMPQRVEIPVGFAAGNLHFLGGVAGWGGRADSRKPAMKVTIEHADGKKQVEELSTGDVFIDYVSADDVPGSRRADGIVTKHHVRYFSLPVNERAPIARLVLESYGNGISPTTLAITADNEAPKPRPKFEPAAPKAAANPEQVIPKTGETLPAKADAGVIRALLIGGGSSHDFEKFFHQTDSATLKSAGKIATAYTSNLEEALALLPNADVIVLSANDRQFGTPEFQQALNTFADAGHGLVIVHAAIWYNWAPASGYNSRFVGGGAKGHGRGEFSVFNRQPGHPVMKGVPADFKITDEHYRIYLDAGTPVEVLAETEPEKETKQPHPAVWVVKDLKARIVGISLGHDARAHDLAEYQQLLSNAVAWVSGR
ncbi:MAG: hypothetical protein QOE70_5112 [Chthoniobacter sp.]|jgi:putative membrane-bound dehydrogenase-like protein|nr:hypothetical protein [Chthoniobacter sp.]